jgi:hypothetical protein
VVYFLGKGMNTTNKIIKIISPTLVTLGIVIGVSLMAVLMLNMVDGMDSIQQADAMKKLPRVEIDPCLSTTRGSDRCQS